MCSYFRYRSNSFSDDRNPVAWITSPNFKPESSPFVWVDPITITLFCNIKSVATTFEMKFTLSTSLLIFNFVGYVVCELLRVQISATLIASVSILSLTKIQTTETIDRTDIIQYLASIFFKLTPSLLGQQISCRQFPLLFEDH